MKTNELIRQLRECDPSGELEVTVGKSDIHFLEVLPGYYDGFYQVLIRDETRDCYNIVGAQIRGNGQHVCINTLSIKAMLVDDPEAPVTIIGEDDLDGHRHRLVEEWREFGRAIQREVEETKKDAD